MERHADIIVGGAGGAGLAAAVAAARAGARVLVVERNRVPGGTFYVSGGTYAAANSRLTRLAGIDDSPEQHLAEAMAIGHGQANPDLLHTIVWNAGPTLDWLLDLGLELVYPKPVSFSRSSPSATPRTYLARGGGKGFVNALSRALDAEIVRGKVRLELGTRLTAIVREPDGTTAGIEAEGPDKKRAIYQAPFVVLAGGGYGGSRAMVERHHPGFEKAVSMCPPHADGSTIVAAAAAGAALVNLDAVRLYPGALGSQNDAWRCATRKYLVRLAPGVERVSVAGAIWVNVEGRRVVDEDTESSEAVERALADASDKTLYVIFDATGRAATEKCPVRAWDWPRFEETAWAGAHRQVAAATTVAQLARRVGIDPDRLIATLARWNGYVKQGADPEFGRDARHSIETPPYYAIAAKGCFMGTMGGVRVNGRGQVIGMNGETIAGLYAIGDTVGAGQYMGRGGIASGMGDTAALTLGKFVGEQLARTVAGDR